MNMLFSKTAAIEPAMVHLAIHHVVRAFQRRKANNERKKMLPLIVLSPILS